MLLDLIVEPSVFIFPKQLRSNHGQGVAFEKFKSLIECIVNVDFAIASNNRHSSGATAVSESLRAWQRGEILPSLGLRILLV